jgi:hypothetical protein
MCNIKIKKELTYPRELLKREKKILVPSSRWDILIIVPLWFYGLIRMSLKSLLFPQFKRGSSDEIIRQLPWNGGVRILMCALNMMDLPLVLG